MISLEEKLRAARERRDRERSDEQAPTSDNPNDGRDNPHRLAAGFLESFAHAGEPLRLRFWRGEFHRYSEGAYHAVPDDDLRGELAAWVREEFVRLHPLDLAAWEESGQKGPRPKVRPVTQNLVGNVLLALTGACLLPAATEAPAWIDNTSGPDPAKLLALRNGILDLEAAVARRPGCLLPATASFFTTNTTPFAYNPLAPAPLEWLGFLNKIWHDDQQSIDTLQEWFGYLLTPDTRQQKIAFLIGPKRSGKGTVARVLRELVGAQNTAGPTLGSLAGNFGLAPLLGKAVAIVADARLSGRTDTAVITERLLSISGEDALTIDRKHRDPITVKLNSRFVILSNELPRLGDASGALAGRLVILRMTQSWYGREDHDLFDRLKRELPGILLWAIEGWRRLRDRGRFVQPESGQELVDDLEDLSSPVGAFVRQMCRIGTSFRVEVGELYQEWKKWCELHGRRESNTEETFGRDLRAVVPELKRSRPRTNEGRLYMYSGIRVRGEFEPDEEESAGVVLAGPSAVLAPVLANTPVNPSAVLAVLAITNNPHTEEKLHTEHIWPAVAGRCDHQDHPDQPPDFGEDDNSRFERLEQEARSIHAGGEPWASR